MAIPQPSSSTTTTTTTSIPPSALPLISPHALLQAHLSLSTPTRPSHRLPSEPNPITLNLSSLAHANGSSLLRIGHTTVVCGVRAEILNLGDIARFDGLGTAARIASEADKKRRRRNQKKNSSSSNNSNKQAVRGEERKTGKTDRYRGTDDENNDDDEDEEETAAQAKSAYAAEIAQHNLLVPNLLLATGASPHHLPGSAPTPEAQALSQRLLALLRTTRLVEPGDLRILYTPPAADAGEDGGSGIGIGSGGDGNGDGDRSSSTPPQQQQQLKAYWTLYIDVVVISYGGTGAVLDAAWLAIYAALRDTVLPEARWDADAGMVVCRAEKERGVRLGERMRGRGVPVGLGWGVFVPERSGNEEDGDGEKGGMKKRWMLSDLDAFEEGCCDERGWIVVDDDEDDNNNDDDDDDDGEVRIIKFEKAGGGFVGPKEIRQLVGRAAERRTEWLGVLKGVGIEP